LRNNYIKQIAKFKTSVEEIKSDERIADVVARARTKAIELDNVLIYFVNFNSSFFKGIALFHGYIFPLNLNSKA